MRLLLLILFCAPVLSFAQTKLKSGNYTTSDGMYTIKVRYDAKANTLTIVEPNKTSEYTFVSGSEYGFTNPTNGIEYRLEIVDATTLESFKPASRNYRTKLYHSGGADEVTSSEDFVDYQKIAEKYKDKMTSDPANAQLWAFCAAAANARSTLNADGFESYAKKVVKQMKKIMEDKKKCPCTDAIPASLWNEITLMY
jgi:hypothetical protein